MAGCGLADTAQARLKALPLAQKASQNGVDEPLCAHVTEGIRSTHGRSDGRMIGNPQPLQLVQADAHQRRQRRIHRVPRPPEQSLDLVRQPMVPAQRSVAQFPQQAEVPVRRGRKGRERGLQRRSVRNDPGVDLRRKDPHAGAGRFPWRRSPFSCQTSLPQECLHGDSRPHSLRAPRAFAGSGLARFRRRWPHRYPWRRRGPQPPVVPVCNPPR